MSKLLFFGASAVLLVTWVFLKSKRETKLIQKENYPSWLKWVVGDSKFLDWIRRNLDRYPYVCDIASPILGGYLKNHYGLQCQLTIGEYKGLGYHVWLKVTDGLNIYYIDATIQQYGGDHRINVFINPTAASYVEQRKAEIPDYLKASKTEKFTKIRLAVCVN